jgi:hypothetical protein
MKTPKASAVAPASDRDPNPPRGLSRSEKGEFARICRLRRAAGRPVSPIETDLVRDYLDARARLIELQNTEWAEQAGSHYFLKDRIALASAVDRAASTVRRLAKDLKLVGA